MLLTHNTKSTERNCDRRNTRALRDREAAQLFFFSTLREGVSVPSRARLPAYGFPPNTHQPLSTKLAIVTTAGTENNAESPSPAWITWSVRLH